MKRERRTAIQSPVGQKSAYDKFKREELMRITNTRLGEIINMIEENEKDSDVLVAIYSVQSTLDQLETSLLESRNGRKKKGVRVWNQPGTRVVECK